ncbi:hypothetical protein QWY75_07690 [Pontixanthobacter aestiaquae]|uniref:Entry exclusion lipoprotein TrbK n=1 Tax=Pontixanthobacter aestiaquae TaxID=1509367 RepID=A0A844Z6H8_9SPHN|nr:hypothetical protein [Pontixanthobacter aestiaquae]MDN3646086.1 hypothetical protein [Pontixanthobacter aestiaquae]MXO82922.1 hypothetical protein [Pontixanthobacter aestiaquae]
MIKYLLGMAVTGLALTSAPAAADKKEEKPKDPEAITCKYIKLVRSRIPERVCRTNFEWTELKREQLQAKEQNRNRSSTCGTSIRC